MGSMNGMIVAICLVLILIAISLILGVVVTLFGLNLTSKAPATAKREATSNIEEVSHTEQRGFYTGYEYQDKKTGICFYELRGTSSSITFQLYNADGSVKTCSSNGLKEVSNEQGYYIFEDTSTGVQYVVATDLSSYFIRQNADGSFYLEEVE